MLFYFAMQNYRVSHRYTRLPDSSIKLFARSVLVGLTNNPAFPDPLIPLDGLSALASDFEQKLLATHDGGKQAMAAKNQARDSLTDALNRQGVWVQGVARQDLAMLLSSGYQVASRNTAQTALARPGILKILNQFSGKLTLRVTPVANARNYQVQMQTGDGEWREAGFFSQARTMVVSDLTPGTVCNLRVRAIGGSTGASDWSDPVSRMSL
jgi:hypothetical protein